MIPANLAAYQAIFARLTVPGGEAWGVRAYPLLAPVGTARPYVLYWLAGGGNTASRPLQQATVVIGVKAVCESLTTAAQAAGRLYDLLHDAGVHDSDTPLTGGDDWVILTTAAEEVVSLRELVDGAPVFHEGFMLRVTMEERP